LDQGTVRRGEALVDALDEERTQRRVRGDVGDDEPDERNGGDSDQETGP
jgi:hypothetical protein